MTNADAARLKAIGSHLQQISEERIVNAERVLRASKIASRLEAELTTLRDPLLLDLLFRHQKRLATRLPARSVAAQQHEGDAG